MSKTIQDIYIEIKDKLTADHLKGITVDIINSYRNKDYNRLNKYASILKLDSEKNITRLFSLLIRRFHPDKLSSIHKEADIIYRSNDSLRLKDFHDNYFFNIGKTRNIPQFNVEFEAEYKFDKDDFGYREKSIHEEDNYGETDLYFREETHGFMEAVNKLFFGGLDENLTESDLNKIDGSLDLSDYDIIDLNGIQHCIYLNELNLSNNSIEKTGKLSALINLRSLFLSDNFIENIEPLKNLLKLKEIDISFNNITDISILENLPELEYLNIIGNPIRDYATINTLLKRGVMVIFDHTNLLF